MPLKYLFTATFADGSTIEQTQEDKSFLEPGKRSAFFDVLERHRETLLVAFVLSGEGHQYGVDLRDGHFEQDGEITDEYVGEPLHDFRIVYWRDVERTIQANPNTGEVNRDSATCRILRYRLGWQANNAEGDNVQRIMTIE